MMDMILIGKTSPLKTLNAATFYNSLNLKVKNILNALRGGAFKMKFREVPQQKQGVIKTFL